MTNNATAIIPMHEPTNEDQAALMWQDMIGEISPQHRRVLGYAAQQNNMSDVSYAIYETALAPQPSLRYFMAIMRRIEREKEETK